MTSPLLDPRFNRVFGTFPLKQEALAQALQCAIDTGYRAVDTAQMYKNEADVGEALAHCGVARDDLCIVTKVHPDNFAPERFMASVEQSLKDLRVNQVDVLLLHWPPKGEDVLPSLKLLDEAAKAGLAKHVGVSNYTSAMMRTAQQTLSVPVATNTMSTKPANISANFHIDDFVLSEADMRAITALNATGYRIVSDQISPWAPVWD